ncbi:MAG: type II toxin-antitoxin system VapC family toxin [Leptolyngbyaceae cyanobacterium bins.302]|nr:type II toxin-antitoxin system VapC family toxin [Leptolyngbyaceae cyanobacterium bins.302]
MIAVDTNVIVRLLTKDDQQQYLQSLKLFQEQDIFIPDTVMLETEWVLRFTYQFKPLEVCQALRKLLGLPNVNITNASWMAQALKWHEIGLDFADALHLAQSQHCSSFYTFDQKIVARAESLTECAVQQP